MGIPLDQAMDFIHNERPEPIVDRRAISGVRERIDVDGDVVARCVKRTSRRRSRDSGNSESTASPVYGKQRWIAILNPSRETCDEVVKPLIAEAGARRTGSRP